MFRCARESAQRFAPCVAIGFLVGLLASPAPAADAPAGAIPGIGPTAAPVELEGTFRFTEGPAADPRGVIYFTDVPMSKVYRVEPGNKTSLFREDTNHANGQMFNAAGEIVTCLSPGKVVAVSADGKSERVLVEQYDGKPLNSPNDLVVDRSGGVYFTDPHFSLNSKEPPKQGVSGVYYIAADGKVRRLIDSVVTPNGVVVSPDEKTLYVIPTVRSEIMAFPITAPGTVGEGRVFCTLAQAEGRTGGGGDGCTVDRQGNLYIATGIGVQVFDRQGKHLGVIHLPKPPSNCKFGGPDFKTLYVTARTSVYAVPMEAAGFRFAAAAPAASK